MIRKAKQNKEEHAAEINVENRMKSQYRIFIFTFSKMYSLNTRGGGKIWCCSSCFNPLSCSCVRKQSTHVLENRVHSLSLLCKKILKHYNCNPAILTQRNGACELQKHRS